MGNRNFRNAVVFRKSKGYGIGEQRLMEVIARLFSACPNLLGMTDYDSVHHDVKSENIFLRGHNAFLGGLVCV